VLLGDGQDVRSKQTFGIGRCLNAPLVKIEWSIVCFCPKVSVMRRPGPLDDYSSAGANRTFGIFRIFFQDPQAQIPRQRFAGGRHGS
jgi:hypothetical protein